MNLLLFSFLFNLFQVTVIIPEAGFNPDADYKFYRAVFWNIENYFDNFADSTTTYNEFDYDGERHWSFAKYKSKRTAIYKILVALGEGQPPALVGLAEIENDFVLRDLLANTPLKGKGYKIIHYESEDRRGIDVGMIYQPEQFDVVFSKKISIMDKSNPNFRTRDILYAKGLLGGDTLHVFINHWTSRYSGYLSSEALRVIASAVLQHNTDSIFSAQENAAILIMGDFNDSAENESIQMLNRETQATNLRLLPLNSQNKNVKGTIKYQGKWDYFDHILVSSSLLDGIGNIQVKNKVGTVFTHEELLEKDEKYTGLKPKRTFIGYKYNGGISDHLPVFVDFVKSDNR